MVLGSFLLAQLAELQQVFILHPVHYPAEIGLENVVGVGHLFVEGFCVVDFVEVIILPLFVERELLESVA